MKLGVWMQKVNRGRRTEEDGVREQIRGRIDFKNPMQLRFPELGM